MTVDLSPMPLVLMYHSVEPYGTDPFQITVRPDRFDRQLRWLHRCGLRGVAVGELLRRHAAGEHRGLVGLTFDDGYTDFLTEAVPALTRYGFTATVFVVAGKLAGHNSWDEPGPRKSLMTADEVRAAAAAGMEIGSHSLIHPALPELSDQELQAEIEDSRSVLAGITGVDIAGFCYPYGKVGAREVDAVRAAGYDYGCAVQPNELPQRYAMPRSYIGDRDNAGRMLAKWARHRLVTR